MHTNLKLCRIPPVDIQYHISQVSQADSQKPLNGPLGFFMWTCWIEKW